jgi:hypothetical protein
MSHESVPPRHNNFEAVLPLNQQLYDLFSFVTFVSVKHGLTWECCSTRYFFLTYMQKSDDEMNCTETSECCTHNKFR